MSHIKKPAAVRFFGRVDTVCHGAGHFPFTEHFYIEQADALQTMRATMTDDEVLLAFAERPLLQQRIAAFLARNPRPQERAA